MIASGKTVASIDVAAKIAELTGLDSGTIKSHLFRAAHKMRERLGDFQKKA